MMGGRRGPSSQPALYRDDRLVGASEWVIGNPANLLMRVPDKILDPPVFLAVDMGGGDLVLGGTAFVLAMRGPPAHMYLVTAAHCVREAQRYGGLYVRFNKHDGGIAFVRIEAPWHFPDSEADDVAVVSLPLTVLDYDFWPIEMEVWAATEQLLETEGIGVGDELVVVGLFTRRGGEHQNRPIVRTGIIAAMPTEPLVDERSGLEYDAYLAEIRSVGGLSGSPVYAMLPPGRVAESGKFEMDRRLFVLLGLIRGHWNKHTEEFADFGESEINLLNTGIAIVTPIQIAVDLIKTTEDLVRERERREQEHAKLLAPTQDSANLPTREDDEFGQFESLARKLVNVPKKDLDEKRKEED